MSKVGIFGITLTLSSILQTIANEEARTGFPGVVEPAGHASNAEKETFNDALSLARYYLAMEEFGSAERKALEALEIYPGDKSGLDLLRLITSQRVLTYELSMHSARRAWDKGDSVKTKYFGERALKAKPGDSEALEMVRRVRGNHEETQEEVASKGRVNSQGYAGVSRGARSVRSTEPPTSWRSSQPCESTELFNALLDKWIRACRSGDRIAQAFWFAALEDRFPSHLEKGVFEGSRRAVSPTSERVTFLEVTPEMGEYTVPEEVLECQVEERWYR